MNKLILLGIVAALSLGAVSCKHNDNESMNTGGPGGNGGGASTARMGEESNADSGMKPHDGVSKGKRGSTGGGAAGDGASGGVGM